MTFLHMTSAFIILVAFKLPYAAQLANYPY